MFCVAAAGSDESSGPPYVLYAANTNNTNFHTHLWLPHCIGRGPNVRWVRRKMA